jgi:hypothetical protein
MPLSSCFALDTLENMYELPDEGVRLRHASYGKGGGGGGGAGGGGDGGGGRAIVVMGQHVDGLVSASLMKDRVQRRSLPHSCFSVLHLPGFSVKHRVSASSFSSCLNVLISPLCRFICHSVSVHANCLQAHIRPLHSPQNKLLHC